QHLSVNLSGTQDRAGPDASGKWCSARAPAHGERRRPVSNLSGARDRVDDRGRGRRSARPRTRLPPRPTVAGPRRNQGAVMSDQQQARFVDRHIGLDAAAVAKMLDVVGVASLDDLAAKALPAGILDGLAADGRAAGLDRLPAAATE